MKTTTKRKAKLALAAVAVVLLTALSVSAVYAWFANNISNGVGGLGLDVVGLSDVSLDATITDQTGEAVASFRFKDAVPGSRFTVTATLKNNTNTAKTVLFVLSDLTETVRPLAEDGAPAADRRYETIKMRHAFLFVENIGTVESPRYADPVPFSRLEAVTLTGKPDGGLALLRGVVVPGNDGTAGSGETRLSFVIEFGDKIIGSDGAELLTDRIVDENGTELEASVPVDINAYQGQKFKIGTLEIVAETISTARGALNSKK